MRQPFGRPPRQHGPNDHRTALAVCMVALTGVLLMGIYLNGRHIGATTQPAKIDRLTERFATDGIRLNGSVSIEAMVQSTCSISSQQEMGFFVGALVDQGTNLAVPGAIIETMCPNLLGDWQRALAQR